MNLAEKELERIFPNILRFKNVQYLDLSSNTLTDITIVADFPNLLHLNVSKNQIADLNAFNCEDKLQRLQFLNISTNKIKELTTILVPALRRLNLTENEIASISWKGHNCLEVLELRKNKLRKLKGLANMKCLQELYVCENEITDVRGL